MLTNIQNYKNCNAYLDDTILAVPPQHAEAAFQAATEIFARAGHQVHPGKSCCWSLDTSPDDLPPACRRIWSVDGLLVGGIPVFDESKEPALAKRKLREVVANATKEAEFLVKLVHDQQVAADEN